MTSPLIQPAELAETTGIVVLDATVELAAPRFDGDHSSASGRAGWEWEHIPGSRHADQLHELSDPAAGYHFAHPTPERLAAALAELGVSDGTDVVVYDRAGGLWAARLWWLLDWIGVPARVLDGGLAAWRDAGLPVVSGPEPAPAAGSLTPHAKPGRWVTLAELSGFSAGTAGATSSGTAGATLTCALSPDAYRGDVPTRYRRRGHIPGTGNVPARSLLGADGRFLEPVPLRAALGALVTDPQPVWLYCGGGISASVVALALAVSGRTDVAIYDGSLEEWSADESLPLTVGPEHVRLPELARELLDRPEFAVLSTTDPDGSAQLSVMWAGRDGDEIVMATKGARRKVRNIRRDPRVTVLLYDRARPTRYVEVRGTATVTGEDAAALVNELARRYTGSAHEGGDPAEEPDRVVLRIVPDRVLARG